MVRGKGALKWAGVDNRCFFCFFAKMREFTKRKGKRLSHPLSEAKMADLALDRVFLGLWCDTDALFEKSLVALRRPPLFRLPPTPILPPSSPRNKPPPLLPVLSPGVKVAVLFLDNLATFPFGDPSRECGSSSSSVCRSVSDSESRISLSSDSDSLLLRLLGVRGVTGVELMMPRARQKKDMRATKKGRSKRVFSDR